MQQLIEGFKNGQAATPFLSGSRDNSDSCTCSQIVVQVLSNIERDVFKLAQLSVDEVVQLQKWLMYQCCTALYCPKCSSSQAVHTIVVLICERVLLMYECLAARMRRAVEEQGLAGAATDGEDYASYYSPKQPNTLFSSITGQPLERARCEGGIYMSKGSNAFSSEEQLCMVHSLVKLHSSSFRSLLEWLGRMSREAGNEAQQGKVMAFDERLTLAVATFDRWANRLVNKS